MLRRLTRCIANGSTVPAAAARSIDVTIFAGKIALPLRFLLLLVRDPVVVMVAACGSVLQKRKLCSGERSQLKRHRYKNAALALPTGKVRQQE